MDAAVNPESEPATVLQDHRKFSMVDGCIVYTRTKRSLVSCNGFSGDGEYKRPRSNAEVPLEPANGVNCSTGGRDGECDKLQRESPEVAATTFKRNTRSAMKASVEETPLTKTAEQGAAAVDYRTRGKYGGRGKLKSVASEVAVRTFKRITRSAAKASVNSGEETVTELEQQGAAIDGNNCSGGRNGECDELKSEPREVAVRTFKRITRSAMKAIVEAGEERMTTRKEQGATVDGKNPGRNGECAELKSEPHEVAVRTVKRITRSAMKTELEQGAVDGEIKDALVAPGNKLELKMSKKIVVNRKPMNMKELLHTGLLDGVSVVYTGIIKKVCLICSVFIKQHHIFREKIKIKSF